MNTRKLILVSALGVASLRAELFIPASQAMAAAINKPEPEYAPLAKQMRIKGEVAVQVRISERGDVADVKLVQGNGLLAPSVLRCVKGWRFRPFESEGKPVVAVTTLRFSFK